LSSIDATVVRARRRRARHDAVLAGRDELRHQRRALRRREVEQQLEGGPYGELLRLDRERGPQPLREIPGQAGQQLEDPCDVAEPAQGLEPRERDDHLGLVLVVPVAALSRVARDAGGLLAREAAACLLAVRVHLERERLGGRENLEQVRESRTEPRPHARAEDAVRIRVDQLAQRRLAAR